MAIETITADMKIDAAAAGAVENLLQHDYGQKWLSEEIVEFFVTDTDEVGIRWIL